MQGRILAGTGLVVLALAPQASAVPQQAPQLGEVRRILREASSLVKDSEELQCGTAAANIVGQQARAGDVAGAFATANSASKAEDKATALGRIAYALGEAGDLAGALRTIGSAAEGQSKAVGYLWLAVQRAEAGEFARARAIAAMIQDQPAYRADTLTRIAAIQWKSGDQRGAEAVFAEAIQLAEREYEDHLIREREERPGRLTSAAPGMLQQIATKQAELGDRAAALATVERLRGLVAEADPAVAKGLLLQDLALTQARIGEIAAALDTTKLLPDYQRDFVLQFIADQQAQHGDPRGGLQTAAGVRDTAWHALALQAIARAQATDGPAAVLETIEQVRGDAERAEALAGAAFAQASKDHAAAAQTAALAWEAAKNAKGEVASHVFGKIAVTRGLVGDIRGALEIVAGMKNGQSRVWPLWNLTGMMVKAGDTRGALALAESQDAPQAKAYALLGVAQGMLDQIEAERKKRGSR